MLVIRLQIAFTAVLLLFGVVQSNAQELLFFSVSDARPILSARDDFLARLSPFDRAARMKTDRDVTEAQFFQFVAASALNWSQQEKSIVETAFEKIQPAVARLKLPLPDKIDVIKTSGDEEGHAAYTRQNAIILPRNVLASPEKEIQRLLAHELFHIFSRSHPNLVKRLYKMIGFNYCGEVEFPPNLALQKITNPDAPKNDYYIQLELGTEKVQAVPILFSKVSKYDVSHGGEFFQYMQLALLLVGPPAGSGTPRTLYDSGVPRLIGLQQVSGFFEQVGQNSGYIIHPEEILADNFALLVLGERNLRSPEILLRMKRILASEQEKEGLPLKME